MKKAPKLVPAGGILIVCGMLPFLLLTTNAFPHLGKHSLGGVFPMLVSFGQLLYWHNDSFSIWSLMRWSYTLSLFGGVLIVALGIVLCTKRKSLIFENRKFGLPMAITLNSFYVFALTINIIMLTKNDAYVWFYVYTISKFLIIASLIFAYVMAQKNNKEQKTGERRRQEL